MNCTPYVMLCCMLGDSCLYATRMQSCDGISGSDHSVSSTVAGVGMPQSA
eukprot:gene11476-biopygen3275